MNMDDQELERAILALPLEEPPDGLRASILFATAYRPAPAFSITRTRTARLARRRRPLAYFPRRIRRGPALRSYGRGDRFGSFANLLKRGRACMACRRRRDRVMAHSFRRISTTRGWLAQVRTKAQPIMYPHGETFATGAAPP